MNLKVIPESHAEYLITATLNWTLIFYLHWHECALGMIEIVENCFSSLNSARSLAARCSCFVLQVHLDFVQEAQLVFLSCQLALLHGQPAFLRGQGTQAAFLHSQVAFLRGQCAQLALLHGQAALLRDQESQPAFPRRQESQLASLHGQLAFLRGQAFVNEIPSY